MSNTEKPDWSQRHPRLLPTIAVVSVLWLLLPFALAVVLNSVAATLVIFVVWGLISAVTAACLLTVAAVTGSLAYLVHSMNNR